MKVEFGYRAVEEQYPPSQLLEFTVRAEERGFDFICISDHFHPWFHTGASAGHAWVWMGAAAARTKSVRLGTGVTTPISYRYHPAVVAQAFATLGEMFPGRIYLGLGTGEAMNEVPLGAEWPNFKGRVERLEEAMQIIKLLWEGEFVTFQGKHFQIRDAKLYTKPKTPLPIYLAASGPTMAKMTARYGFRLMTFAPKTDDQFDPILNALREGAKENGRDYEAIPKMLEMGIAYDEDYDKALTAVARWRSTTVPGILNKLVTDPRELERLGGEMATENLFGFWTVCTSLEQCTKRIEAFVKRGFNEIQIHSGSPDEAGFIEKFGREVLPHLKEQYNK